MGDFESDESADRFGVSLGYFNASPNFRAGSESPPHVNGSPLAQRLGALLILPT